jgi:hypothetical protein
MPIIPTIHANKTAVQAEREDVENNPSIRRRLTDLLDADV